MTHAGAGTGVMSASAGAVEVRFAPGSLDVRTQVVLDSARRRVFDALLHIPAWWPHRVRRGTSIVMEPRVGGRFFENCDDGCGILLGHVAKLIMPVDLAIQGPFGFASPVIAVWSVKLDAENHRRTILQGRFEAFGVIGEGDRAVAAPYWETTYAALAHYLDA